MGDQASKLHAYAGVQAKEAGLATHYLASSQLPSLLEALEGLGAEAGSREAVGHLLHEAEVRPRWLWHNQFS